MKEATLEDLGMREWREKSDGSETIPKTFLSILEFNGNGDAYTPSGSFLTKRCFHAKVTMNSEGMKGMKA